MDTQLRETLKNKKRVIVKIGSSSLLHEETGKLNLLKLERLVRELCVIKNQGMDVCLVIPPVPTSLPTVSPAMFSIRLSIFSTTGINSAFGFFLGSSVYNPSISDKRINKSAPTNEATIADRESLSPNCIS